MSFGPTSKSDPGSTPTVHLRFALRSAAAPAVPAPTEDRGSPEFAKAVACCGLTDAEIDAGVQRARHRQPTLDTLFRPTHPEGCAALRAVAVQAGSPRKAIQPPCRSTRGRVVRPPNRPPWPPGASSRAPRRCAVRRPRPNLRGGPSSYAAVEGGDQGDHTRSPPRRTGCRRVVAEYDALTVTSRRPKPTRSHRCTSPDAARDDPEGSPHCLCSPEGGQTLTPESRAAPSW
jgi:hypothetical protein